MVGGLYTADPMLKQAKFGYWYGKFVTKYYQPVIEEMQKEIVNARIEYALEDPTTKAILNDPANGRGFKYSKEGLRQVIAAEQKIVKEYNAKEIEIEPMVSPYVPELTEEQREMLEGVVL